MDNYANALKSLDTILRSYDPRNLPRPQSGNGNVTIETNAYIRKILEVDEHKRVRLEEFIDGKYPKCLIQKILKFCTI